MEINFKDLLKEQIVFLIIPILLLVGLIGGSVYFGTAVIASSADVNNKKQQVTEAEQKKSGLEAQLAQLAKDEKSPDVKQTLEWKRHLHLYLTI